MGHVIDSSFWESKVPRTMGHYINSYLGNQQWEQSVPPIGVQSSLEVAQQSCQRPPPRLRLDWLGYLG